jgi:ubiquinone/menaquinone biosynthesis C-methylase UbiE
MSADPHGFHDWHDDAYVDEWIARDADRPERVLMLRGVVASLPFDHGDALRVLDIGGGWGVLTAEVLSRFPNASVVLHDFSEPMLARAAEHLAGFGDRVTFRRADLSDPRWTDAVGGSFDAVVSSSAIHNVRHPATIERIYHDVFPLVRTGGEFVNVDRMPTDAPAEEQIEWLRAAGFGDIRVEQVDDARVALRARRALMHDPS